MNSKFFAGNRSKLLNQVNSAPIVLSANGLIQRTRDDEVFPFEQDGNFWYLTGVDEPDVLLVMDGSKEYLILPKRDDRHKVFSEQVDKAKLKNTSGISEIYDYDEGWEKLAAILKKSKSFHTVKPPKEFLSSYDVYSNPASRRFAEKVLNVSSTLEQKDISREIISLRTIKNNEEVNCIRQAIKCTGEILERISSNIDDYKNEHDISADLNDFYFRNKLDYAFLPIVAAGKNATILHYKSNKDPISKGASVLIDTGVKFNNYCSDITRTIMKNPTTRQKAVYKAVADTQEYAMGLLKPGVSIREYEIKVAKFMGAELKKLGLIKQANNENVRKYYPHGTSHSLGIDVHDPADYSKPLEAGMVITVEPGIYIPEEDLGVRIEDNVLITQDGVEELSSSIIS
ncbi:MAG TPA: Xaa-Pro aminopeptidase [Candidatus Saccharimonadales bacterium]|nr:Xaa-Pro aminopeptidase [Candidatus Saccharimonadales bacterium]